MTNQIVQLKVSIGDRKFTEDFKINGNTKFEDFKTEMKKVVDERLLSDTNFQVMFDETKQQWSKMGSHPYNQESAESVAERKEAARNTPEAKAQRERVGDAQAGRTGSLTEKNKATDVTAKNDDKDESTLTRPVLGSQASGINQTDTNPELEKVNPNNDKKILEVQQGGTSGTTNASNQNTNNNAKK